MLENVTIYYVMTMLLFAFLLMTTAIIGGAFDIRYLIKELKQKKVDENDDGRVL